MIKYRVAYGVCLIGAAVLFVYWNSAWYLEILLTMIVLPVILKMWILWKIRTMEIRIVATGPFLRGEPCKIKVEAAGKHCSAVGRITGRAEVYHCVLDERKCKELCLFDRENVWCDEFIYQEGCCGRVRVKVKNLKVYDCLGLTVTKLLPEKICDFVLYPEEKKKIGNDGIAKHFGEEFVGVRAYQEGDMMSSVHWKLSSKWDELYVRQYSEPSAEIYGAHGADAVCTECKACKFAELCYNK